MEAIIAQLEQLKLKNACPPQTLKINIVELSKMTLHLYRENIVLKNEIQRLRSSPTIIDHMNIPKWIT